MNPRRMAVLMVALSLGVAAACSKKAPVVQPTPPPAPAGQALPETRPPAPAEAVAEPGVCDCYASAWSLGSRARSRASFTRSRSVSGKSTCGSNTSSGVSCHPERSEG